MKKYAVIFFLPLVMMGCFSDAHGPTIDPQTEAPTDASPSTPPPEVSPTNKVAMILRFDASREESKCFDIGIAPEITPEALLACSGYPTELTDFGGNLGKGLCGIDSVGCMASNCFCDNTKSWFFLHEVADCSSNP